MAAEDDHLLELGIVDGLGGENGAAAESQRGRDGEIFHFLYTCYLGLSEPESIDKVDGMRVQSAIDHCYEHSDRTVEGRIADGTAGNQDRRAGRRRAERQRRQVA